MGALRRALLAGGYDEERLREVLRLRGRFLAASRIRRPLHVLRARDEPLVRLLLLETPVRIGELGDLAGDLIALELARADGEHLVPLVTVTPYEGLLLIADLDVDAGPSDVVPGLSHAGVTLAHLTPRDHVGTALDLGTGFGMQALLAARHADLVVATDLNPRALRIAELNAELNEISNVTFRSGDLFAPVAGERFDLIVSNPPFAVGPDERFVYRDGGAPFCERVVRGSAAALAEGGIAVIAAGWLDDGIDPWAPVRAWLAGCGCDALVLRLAELDPLANGWLYTGEGEATERWADSISAAGAVGVSYGNVILRRRAGGGRTAMLDLLGKDVPKAGAHVARIMRNLEWLAANEERLAESRLRPAEGLERRTVEQVGPAVDPPRPARLALRRGLPFVVPADASPVELLERGLVEPDDRIDTPTAEEDDRRAGSPPRRWG